jgi:hypothetical protein
VRLCQRGKAKVRDRSTAVPDQDGRPIDDQTVDQVGAEKGSRRSGATFDEQIVDVSECKYLVRAAEPAPPFRSISPGQQARRGDRCSSPGSRTSSRG